MCINFSLALLAAADSNAQLQSAISALTVLGVLILPFVVAHYIARAVKMKGYGWKIGVALSSIACGVAIVLSTYDPATGTFNFKRGVDLKGGSILIYQVQTDAADDQGGGGGVTSDLVQALSNRINPSGTQEIVIRPYGERQVEIIIPDVDPIEVERIKKLISTAGSLEFRIVANAVDHSEPIELARQQADEKAKWVTRAVEKDGQTIEQRVAMWARIGREAEAVKGRHPLKIDVRNEIGDPLVRDAFTGEILDTTPFRGAESLDVALEEQGIREIDVLMATNDGVDVTGEHLGTVSPGVDNNLRPCVNFSMKGEGVPKFAALTRNNLPENDFFRHLGIVLDGNLLSAPRILSTISDRGQITGQFTEEEVNFTVGILRAGRLPATLQREPISENQIGSLLGEDTIRKGTFAIGVSLLSVLVFIIIYYRFAGLVACLALLTNLVLILALMVLMKAPLTLPGLAGLVLTVGMSVDANVLIFERIREEMTRGAALRMAIRNGFARATTTIVDANVTTLITAIVLYAIGTDQIRGFAVTLILGILMSMYTAIFCSRVVFDIAERRRWITSLRMMHIIGATHIDFIGRRVLAGVLSVTLITVGLVAVVARGKDIFDIDFLGGTSVTMMLKEQVGRTEDVRARVGAALGDGTQFSITNVDVEGKPKNTVFKVDSALGEVQDLQQKLRGAFRSEQGDSQLVSYSMNFSDLQTVAVSEKPSEPEAGPPADSPARPTTPAGPSLPPAVQGPVIPPPGINPPTKPETPEPEPTKPEPTKPETPEPEPTKPEPTKPETPEPEPTKPEPTKPEPTKPETPEPEPTKPEPTKPETPEPEPNKPEPTKPETPEPEPTKPEPTKPETPEPEPNESEPADGDATQTKSDTTPSGSDAAPSDEQSRVSRLLTGAALAFEGDALALLAQADAGQEPDAAASVTDEAEDVTDEAEDVTDEADDAAAPKEGDASAAPKEGDASAAPKEGDDAAAPKEGDASAAPKEGDDAAAPKEGDASAPPTPAASQPAESEEAGRQDPEPSAEATGAATDEPEKPGPQRYQTTATLTFSQKINAPTLKDRIETTAVALNRPLAGVELEPIEPKPNVDWTEESAAGFTKWSIELQAGEEHAQAVLSTMKSNLSTEVVWPSSSTIGGKVAGDTQRLAIAALLASLLGIIGYIWIRFQRVVFGLAAVVALVHDVLITLGAIAISAWLAPMFGFLLIDEFKISLPVVAAFLTIIGYSLNDTIVVFDRIREVRGKSPDVNGEMINRSINQTLARTVLTSVTTLLVVMILYSLGGQEIHGFAFALVVGVMVGTYSSIFVASPALLWMSKAQAGKTTTKKPASSMAASP